LSNCRLPRSVSGGGGGIGGDRATFIGNTKVTTINLGLQYVFSQQATEVVKSLKKVSRLNLEIELRFNKK
jgi:hypothetical protein